MVRSADLQLPTSQMHLEAWEAYTLDNVQRLRDLLDIYRKERGDTDACFSYLLCNAIVVNNGAMIQCLLGAGVPVTRDVAQEVAKTGRRDAVAQLLEIGWQIDEPCNSRSLPILGYVYILST